MLLALQTNGTADVSLDNKASILPENQVSIGIDSSSKTLNINKLKRLPYFAVSFSDRWMKQRKNTNCTETIDIFDNQQETPFALDDLVLLLQCIATVYNTVSQILKFSGVIIFSNKAARRYAAR